MSGFRIGEVARQTGVSVEAIRYYENQALIPRAPRSEAGYRVYGAETIRRVRFIQRAKELGFSLRDIHSLLTLRKEPEAACADVKVHALKKVAEVEEKIDSLSRIRDALVRLVDKCNTEAPLSECPILDALEEEEGGARDAS